MQLPVGVFSSMSSCFTSLFLYEKVGCFVVFGLGFFWGGGLVLVFFFPCSEGIVGNLGYLQSRRKPGIIYGTYVKACFIQLTICMRFFCSFIIFFYPGDPCLEKTVPKRSCLFQMKSLKKSTFFFFGMLS